MLFHDWIHIVKNVVVLSDSEGIYSMEEFKEIHSMGGISITFNSRSLVETGAFSV